MVEVAQLVRASDCGSEGRGFDPLFPPKKGLIACEQLTPFLWLILDLVQFPHYARHCRENGNLNSLIALRLHKIPVFTGMTK